MSKKLWIENISNPAVYYQEVTPGAGYTDETNNMFAWDSYGSYVMDYYHYRLQISTVFYAIAGGSLENWPTMTPQQKEIGARYMLVPFALRVPAVQTDAEDKTYWMQMVDLTEGRDYDSLQGRALIVENMRLTTSNWLRIEQITKPDTQDFFKTVFDFTAWFIEADAKDLIQWITNEVGSPYENDGFLQKPYYDVSLKDALVDVYYNPQ